MFWNEADRLSGIKLSLIRQVMSLANPEAINLALGELGFELPSFLKEEAKRIIDYGTAVYTPNAGLPELRQVVAEASSHYLSQENVCICNGAEEAIYLSMLSVVNPGDSVAIPDPDYSAYPAIARIMGANVLRLPFNDELQTIDWDRWKALLSQNVKFLILSNPSNPTGFCYNEHDLKHLADICNQNQITVIVDEIYHSLYFDKEPTSWEGRFDFLIRIGGLSKSHCMSGWRLGWVLADKEIMPSIIKAKQYVSTCAPWLSQKLALVALSPEGMVANAQIRERLKQNQRYAVAELSSTFPTLIQPLAGPYIMFKVSRDDLQFAQEAARNGVICVPGRAFGTESNGWIRINIGVEEPLLQKGLARLKETL